MLQSAWRIPLVVVYGPARRGQATDGKVTRIGAGAGRSEPTDGRAGAAHSGGAPSRRAGPCTRLVQ
jgi:hypothetical protein